MMNDLKKYGKQISSSQTRIYFGSNVNSRQLERSIWELRVDKIVIDKYCVRHYSRISRH